MTEARALILGAGSWGTAVAQLLAESGKKVTLWSSTGNNYQSLLNKRRHPKLQDFTLHPDVLVTNNLREALICANVLMIAVASCRVRQLSQTLASLIDKDFPIVILSKGLEFPSGKTLSEVVREELGDCSVSVLSGGSHAEEVIRGLPFGLTLAGGTIEAQTLIRSLFVQTPARISILQNAKQVEWFASLKNLLSIGVGISDTYGLGDNFRACFITDVLREAEVTFQAYFGNDYDGLCSYGCLGDLFATIFSPHSRNRRYGILLGKGLTENEALEQVGMVVEGVNVARVVLEKLDRRRSPICFGLAKYILSNYQNKCRQDFLSLLGMNSIKNTYETEHKRR